VGEGASVTLLWRYDPDAGHIFGQRDALASSLSGAAPSLYFSGNMDGDCFPIYRQAFWFRSSLNEILRV